MFRLISLVVFGIFPVFADFPVVVGLSEIPGVAREVRLPPGGVQALVPDVYREELDAFKLAKDLMESCLVYQKPRVTDPAFHQALVLGVFDALANRVYHMLDHPSPWRIYLMTVTRDFPLIFQNPVNSSVQLRKYLEEIHAALQPLIQIVDEDCQNLDYKDCNVLIEFEINKEPQNVIKYPKRRAGNVLRYAIRLARLYFKLHYDVVLAANRLTGEGYVLRNRKHIIELARILESALEAARRMF